MRTCMAKIQNVFRTKPIRNESDHKQLHDTTDESLTQCMPAKKMQSPASASSPALYAQAIEQVDELEKQHSNSNNTTETSKHTTLDYQNYDKNYYVHDSSDNSVHVKNEQQAAHAHGLQAKKSIITLNNLAIESFKTQRSAVRSNKNNNTNSDIGLSNVDKQMTSGLQANSAAMSTNSKPKTKIKLTWKRKNGSNKQPTPVQTDVIPAAEGETHSQAVGERCILIDKSAGDAQPMPMPQTIADVSANETIQSKIEQDLLADHSHQAFNSSPQTATTTLIANAHSDDIYLAEPKTPEEIEYEANIAAESKDVMTPLPPLNSKQPFPFGRNVQPEIVDLIRNMDADALRINNITHEEKLELMRRFDNQQLRRHSRLHTAGSGNSSQNKHYRRLQAAIAAATATAPVTTTEPFTFSVQSSRDGVGQAQAKELGVANGFSLASDAEVVLRRKDEISSEHHAEQPCSLYERRQPKTPKLKLLVQPAQNATSHPRTQATVLEDKENKTSGGEHERNLTDLKYPTLLPPNPQLRALLVFPKTDNICDVIKSACHRHQLEVTQVKSMDSAIENLHRTANPAECFHLIIIDARYPKTLDPDHLSTSIRHIGHHFTTIVAVVKKNFFEKDDAVIALLNAGVNRCMPETTNLTMCSIEIKQILHSIVRPHNVMATQQALYTALHRLKEVLIITDDVLRIQYANKATERLLNMRLDEIISKPLAEIFISDVSSISAHGKSIKEFDGILTVRRKNQEGIGMHVRVVPVACIGSTPTHFIFNFDVPGGQTDFIATLPQPKEAPRGSLHSVRRCSFDVRSIASDGLRRTSLAKLTSLPLEAPITKIINLLSQVQENCSADEARLIDKVLEVLKREGLYSPHMKEIRTEDPIATDLIGALLTGPSVYSSRRSSNDSIIRSGRTSSTVMPSKMKSNPIVMELLEESLSWDFDIFKLEEITEYRPLLYLGMEIFRRFDIFSTLNIDEAVCKNWLAVIEDNYHKENTYHNSTHAADVMQAAAVFITQLGSKDNCMDRIDEATILIAAAAHDVDHPGRSSAFLCNSNNPLAILYNDLSVLESHHAAITFKLTLSDDKVNIFKNLDKDAYKSARSTIIDMILATEMTRHFEHLAKFVSELDSGDDPKEVMYSDEEKLILMRRMLIKVADVSNPARPLAYCVEWARRIAEEYFTQTDEEKAKNLPIVMPMFDRQTCSVPKSQIGFIEYIVQDMMNAWDCFIKMPELIMHMQVNYAQWEKFEKQGIHTLADIKSKVAPLHGMKSHSK